MKPIKIELTTCGNEFAKLEPEWNSLLLESEANNVFLTWEWISAWRTTLGKQAKLWVMIARDEQTNQLIAVVPLMIRERMLKGIPILKELAFLTSGKAAPDHLDVILHKDYKDQLLVELGVFFQKQEKQWDCIHLEGCRKDAVVTEILLKKNQRVDSYPVICPYLALPESWEAYLKSLDKKRRYKIGSYRRKLEASYPNGVIYQCISLNDFNDQQISDLFALHQQAQQAQGRAGAFGAEDSRSFHRLLIKQFLEKDWLRLYFLRVDNKAIATVYSFNYNGVISFYTTGFDAEWRDYSPGQQMIYFVLEQVMNEKAKEFDFLRGDEDYKFMMTKTVREDFRIIIPQSLLGKLFALVLHLKKSHVKH